MGTKRSPHETPKGQLRAIHQAMTDTDVGPDRTVDELIRAVHHRIVVEQVGEYLAAAPILRPAE